MAILSTTLDTSGDAVTILIWAAAVGAVASIVAELLIPRGAAGDTGALEWPGWRQDAPTAGGRKWYDLGSWAAIPLGIVAAAIAGLLLTPTQEVIANGQTTRTMELEKLLGIALVAGLSSSAFLSLVQERFIAVAKQQQLDAALKGAIASFDEIAKDDPAPPAPAAGTTQNVVAASSTDEAEAVAAAISVHAANHVTHNVRERCRIAKQTVLAAAGHAED